MKDGNDATIYQIQSRSLDGFLGDRILGNGAVQSSRSYDPLTGRVANIEATGSNGPGYQIWYGYDPGGNLEYRDDFAVGRFEAFTYDGVDRLQTWSLDNAGVTTDTTFLYDATGNIESVIPSSGPPKHYFYGWNGKPHCLSSDSTGSYTYDDRGRQLTGPNQQRSITYNGFSLPATVTTAAGTTSFRYDAFGLRVRQSGPGAEVVTIDDLDERREAGGQVDHIFYVRAETGVVAQVALRESTAAWSRKFVETDALGSTGFVTDEAGNETDRLYFDPRRADQRGWLAQRWPRG